MTFSPGWADTLGKALTSRDEVERATAIGMKPRRNFKIDRVRQAESARRGGLMKHGKRKVKVTE